MPTDTPISFTVREQSPNPLRPGGGGSLVFTPHPVIQTVRVEYFPNQWGLSHFRLPVVVEATTVEVGIMQPISHLYSEQGQWLHKDDARSLWEYVCGGRPHGNRWLPETEESR